MDFGDSTPMSRNKAIGIGIVIVLHIFLVYALVSGLATSAVSLIKKPLEIKIVQAAPPPPPPAAPPPPPPVLTAPPPPYIPPPIVQVQQPPQQKPVFAVTSSAKPTGSTAMAHAVSIGVVCPNITQISQALSDAFQNISDSEGVNSANVVVEFSVTASGAVVNPHVVSSTFPGVNQLALQGVGMLSCRGQGQTVLVRAPFDFEAN